MRLRFRQSMIPICALLAVGAGAGEAPELPKVDGVPIVAKVNGEPITLDRFLSEVASLHEGMAMGENKRPSQKPGELLERLINTRLIVQEATVMGLGELPKYQEMLKLYRDQALAALVLRHGLQDLELDSGTVEARVRERVKELQLSSVRFENGEDAAALVAAVEAGGDFRELAVRMEGEGKVAALELDDEQFIKINKLLPQIQQATSGMAFGEISPAVAVEDSFVVFVIVEMRFPDNPQVRQIVEQEVWGAQRATATTEYVDSLIDRHASIDFELLEKLDFEAKEPGFANLLEDERVLVGIEGEEPLTVGRFAEKVQAKFHHGIEGAIDSKRVNAVKREVLYDMLRKRVVLTEARKLEFDKSVEYREMLETYEDRMLFGLFVKRVVDPDVRLDDTTLKSYLTEHADEYTLPEMMRIDGLAFGTKDDAENALNKLSEGAEFGWIRRNGAGRLADDDDTLKLRGGLLVTTALPDEAREAVTGARAGELRLCSLPGGPFYVLRVIEVIPTRPQPMEDAMERVVPKVLAEQRTRLIEDWAKKVREVSEVEIYASGDSLRDIIGMPRAESK